MYADLSISISLEQADHDHRTEFNSYWAEVSRFTVLYLDLVMINIPEVFPNRKIEFIID